MIIEPKAAFYNGATGAVRPYRDIEVNDAVGASLIQQGLAKGVGGGGSAEPLICTYGDGHLDTTFGDILEAVANGRPVVLMAGQPDDPDYPDCSYYTLDCVGYARREVDTNVLKWMGEVNFYSNYLSTSAYDTYEELLADYPFYTD